MEGCVEDSGMKRRGLIGRLSLVLGGLVIGLVLALAPGSWFRAAAAWQVDERAALTFFQREPLAFLVTERIVTQVVVEKHGRNVLLGDKHGFLFGTVELLYGIDLADLPPESVRRDDRRIFVSVPTPELLHTVPDLDSVRFLQKRSPMVVLADKMAGSDLYRECLLELDDAALRFAEQNGLTPTREELLGRLNEYAPVIAAKIGSEVIFE